MNLKNQPDNNNQDYSQGYNQNYNQSYNQSYDQNYNQGYNQNYTQNYNQGYNQNYGQGYAQAYNQSYGNFQELTAQKYNLIIGGTLLYGFIINCLMIQFCFDAIASVFIGSPIMFYITYFVMVFAGTMMVSKSTSVAVSFIGYNLIVVPLGMIIALVVNAYAAAGYSSVIATAFAITAVVTLIMMFVSSAYPEFFLSIGRTLLVTMLITLVVELVFGFMGFDLGVIDYIVVLIFCGWIGYDWARANSVPRTTYNAIDAAANLYVDIVNLFLRIMRILARSSNN